MDWKKIKISKSFEGGSLILISGIILNIVINFLKPTDGQFTSCDPACQRGIDDTNEYITSLHKQLTENQDGLLKRVIRLENDETTVIEQINSVSRQVSTVQSDLAGNMTTVNQRITDDFNYLWREMSDLVNQLRVNLTRRLDELTATVNFYHGGVTTTTPPPPTTESPQQIYLSLTKRIDSLEYGKVYNLSIDNQMWRRNFRVINSTFARIKNNNCACR